ncbi:MAG: hypothetical protein FWC27_15285 [Firmicutes bacterium]|nr:hypothetical protein [Bacillota bacterium]
MTAAYDGKTSGCFEVSGQFFLPSFEQCDEAIFKASYTVGSNIVCGGKVTALFNLTVLGDIQAAELDVKGRLICLGVCEVSGSILVHDDIWVNDMRAATIETHDRIVAQDIDVGTLTADNSILVGKTLAVETIAKSEKTILCGETAFGAGKVAARTIITGEPLDLDDGEESVISPNAYRPGASQPAAAAIPGEPIDLIACGETEYAPKGNFTGYLDFLSAAALDDETRAKFARWKETLREAEALSRGGLNKYTNIAMLLWLAEIAGSAYFKNWDRIGGLLAVFSGHFRDLLQRDRSTAECRLGSYAEWLEALSVLSRCGALMDSAAYDAAFELAVSYIGLKAKFVSERLNEKGWVIHAE